MVIDFSEANDEPFNSEWEPVPEGRYDAFVYQVEDVDGYEAIDITYKIDGGEHDGREVVGRQFHSTPKALGALKNIVIGNINPDFEPKGTLETGELHEALVSNPCRIEVKHERKVSDGEERVYENIDGVYSPSEEQLDTADHLPA